MTKRNEIPEFKTLEEEREYWESRGSLEKGHITRANPKQKRSSFLAVRMTGEEITRLRDLAARKGLGPSTYARILLTSAIERGGQPDITTLKEIKDMIEEHLSKKTAAVAEKKSRYKT
jgi:hypothetical protein